MSEPIYLAFFITFSFFSGLIFKFLCLPLASPPLYYMRYLAPAFLFPGPGMIPSYLYRIRSYLSYCPFFGGGKNGLVVARMVVVVARMVVVVTRMANGGDKNGLVVARMDLVVAIMVVVVAIMDLTF